MLTNNSPDFPGKVVLTLILKTVITVLKPFGYTRTWASIFLMLLMYAVWWLEGGVMKRAEETQSRPAFSIDHPYYLDHKERRNAPYQNETERREDVPSVDPLQYLQ